MKIEDRSENMERIAEQMRASGKTQKQIEAHFRALAKAETDLLNQVLNEWKVKE